MGSSPPALPPPGPPVSGVLFAVLVRQYAPYIRRMVRDAGVREADLEDVLQEVFIALHLAIGRGLNVAAPLQEWLQKTTYRIARHRLKRASNAREELTHEGVIEQADEAPSPEVHVETSGVRRMVLGLLDELPSDLRMVLAMSDIDEMPMRLIAEVLEIPEGTGYSRLRAARHAFESAWVRRREEQAPHAVALGIAPFLLFEAHALLETERSIPVPDASHALDQQLWDRLVEALGPGLTSGAATVAALGGAAAAAHGGAVAAADGAAVAATSGQVAGVLLTVKEIAVVVVLSIVSGAGLHALLPLAKPDAELTGITADATRAAATSPQPVAESSQPNINTKVVATATTSPDVDAGAPIDLETSERNVLERAQAALSRAVRAQDTRDSAREITLALAALEEHKRRFKHPVFAGQREALRRQILAYQAAHQVPEGR